MTRIRRYERDPRQCPNPEYDRIKASILATGLDQLLTITQRPGEADYIVQAGGNTRLRILKELFDATGEERFCRVNCLVVAWQGEAAVLLAHLRENELRGNLTFIERAQAVFAVRDLLAAELDRHPISVRDLETLLKENGYGVSVGLISQMGYAVSVLLPLMPVSLQAGLGKSQVQRVRNLERVARDVWQRHEIGNKGEFDRVFGTLCRRYDGPDWQYELLQQAIEVEIAEAIEASIQVIRLEFECRLSGREPEIPDFVEPDEMEHADFPKAARDEPAIPSAAEKAAEASVRAEGATHARVAEAIAVAESADRGLALAIELPCDTDTDALYRLVGGQGRGLVPMELLRNRAFQLARRMAARHGIGELIAAVNDTGLGFVVRDVPAASLTEALDEALLSQVSTLWWQLVSFAEMTRASPAFLATWLEEDSALRVALETGHPEGLLHMVRPGEPAHLAERFWRRLSHADWCDWLALAYNYRELHRMAQRTGSSLWETGP